MNQQQLSALIEEFDYKLTRTHLGVEEFSIGELIYLFQNIIQVIPDSHEIYWKNIPRLFSILDKNQSSSVIIATDLYFNLFNQLVNLKEVPRYDSSIILSSYDETIPAKFEPFIAKTVGYGRKIQLSEFVIDTSSLSEKEKREFISFIIDFLELEAEKATWTKDIIHNTYLFIAILRNLAKDFGDYTAFYKITGLIIDKMSFSEFFQHSRDYAEELTLCSYIDGRQEWGFFNFHRCFSNSSSIVRSLLYANLSMTVALKNKERINLEYVKEIIWQGIKCFRNASLHFWVEKIYNSISPNLTFSPYQQRSIAHSYFLSLLQRGAPELPVLILEHFSEHREDMLATGVHDVFPWLVTLYNIKELYPRADFSATGLGFYLSVFEMIVPDDDVKRYRGIISGDLDILKPELRNSISKISQTRYFQDIVQDNDKAISFAAKLIKNAVKESDFEALILAMMVRADFSLIFKEKVRAEFSMVENKNNDGDEFGKLYQSEAEVIATLKEIGGVSFVWLINSSNENYEMLMEDSVLSATSLNDWDHEAFKKLIKEQFFSKLGFDDTRKDERGGIFTIFSEEHEANSFELQKQFPFAKIECASSTLPLLVVMDMNLSGLPHNLLMNAENQLIYLKRPIGNILSTEWYLKYANQTKLTPELPRTIWIPTESGDFTINQLHSKLESNISDFEVIQSPTLTKKISSEIVILTAHGEKDIALTNLLYTNDDTPTNNPFSLFEDGKLLILFICHSGSVQSTPFKNSISTLIKEYITLGFSSVIAPFWGLSILIPPIWLPVFMNSIKEGHTVIEAVYKANLEINKHYPTLSAWSCLHLYGDPHLSIEG